MQFLNGLFAVLCIGLGLIYIVILVCSALATGLEDEDEMPLLSMTALACSAIWGGLYYFFGG